MTTPTTPPPIADGDAVAQLAALIFVDEYGYEVGRVLSAPHIPRVGEIVSIQGTWYTVGMVGYSVVATLMRSGITLWVRVADTPSGILPRI